MSKHSPDSRLKQHPFGFLEAVQKPSKEELEKYYADMYYQNECGSYKQTYSEDEKKCFRIKTEQKARILEDNIQSNGRTLLDVGCGEGFDLAYFCEKGWDAKGIDFSSEGATAMNPSILDRLTTGDIFQLLEDQAKEGNMYDVIWIKHVLEHVLDPVEVLKNLRKLVKPGGILVATVPNDACTYNEDLFQRGDISKRFWIALPDHLSYFNQETLIKTCNETGWKCLDCITDVPINFFLSHSDSNYVDKPETGPNAHIARLKAELLISKSGVNKANDYFRAQANVGLGRSLTAFFSPKGDN